MIQGPEGAFKPVPELPDSWVGRCQQTYPTKVLCEFLHNPQTA